MSANTFNSKILCNILCDRHCPKALAWPCSILLRDVERSYYSCFSLTDKETEI